MYCGWERADFWIGKLVVGGRFGVGGRLGRVVVKRRSSTLQGGLAIIVSDGLWCIEIESFRPRRGRDECVDAGWVTRRAGNGRRLDRQALFSAETIRLRESLIQRCRGRCRGHSNVCSVTTGCEAEERGAAPTSSQWHRVRSAAGPRWGCGLGAGLGAGPLGPRNSARMMAAIATGVRRLAE